MKKFTSLAKYKDIHKGERCFVILTGPSLTLHDVELLKDEVTFSCNSIFKLFDKTMWRPTYYVISDKRVVNSIGEAIYKNTTGIPVFYRYPEVAKGEPFDISEPYKALWWGHVFHFFFKKTACIGWSDDIVKGIKDAPTVVYAILQIACYMGFKEIYLLGADCDYSTTQHNDIVNYEHKHKIKANAGLDVIQTYKSAINSLKKRKNAPKIYNATRGGKLELFPRVNLDELLKEEK